MGVQEGTFIDRVKLRLRAGDGGDGVISFRHEKYVPFGGPDGGDGGRGGNIVFRVHSGLNTLEKLHSQPLYRAGHGKRGDRNNRTGADGDDVILSVPPGSVVIRAETSEHIVDMEETSGEAIIARGGHGGKGNTRFATSTNQAPRRFTCGVPGEEITVIVELKLVAGVGLVGLPNAGKSSLISALTGARPKIADYPFTTLQPVLGTLPTREGDSIVLADIPGILHGAHAGVGLGLEFLRHIERTRMLLYVIELSPADPDGPARALREIREEIRCYDEKILERPYLVALNKIDLFDDPSDLEAMIQWFGEECPEIGVENIALVSALRREGTETIKQEIIRRYNQIPSPVVCSSSWNDHVPE